MKPLILAGNWKMNHDPASAREFIRVFLQRYRQVNGHEVWLFPPAVAIEAVATLVSDRPDILVGAQNVYWEPTGAFTGETGIPMAHSAGARAALVGHSERRHVFGETDEETGKKVRALLNQSLIPVLCVGETLDQREAGDTNHVVTRQLSVLEGLDEASLERVVIAYEPVWAIGTGRNATPDDAAQIHGEIRGWLAAHGARGDAVPILYGGSVKPENVVSLIAQDEIDGVLVGGASLSVDVWSAICTANFD
jgi:triosephosphate isomerase (TIM)